VDSEKPLFYRKNGVFEDCSKKIDRTASGRKLKKEYGKLKIVNNNSFIQMLYTCNHNTYYYNACNKI
jgi:hypothetical protein